MAAKKGATLGQVALGALGLAGATIGAVLVYNYAKSGGGSKKNAVLIPDTIEDRIDLIVDMLNAKWPDKRWADKGLHTVASYLESTLPPEVTRLIDVIQEAETQGAKQNLSGPLKLALAVKLAGLGRAS